jgi:hypothetical protein
MQDSALGAPQVFVINENIRMHKGRVYRLIAIKLDPESRGLIVHGSGTKTYLCYINGEDFDGIAWPVQGDEEVAGFVEPISHNEYEISAVWYPLPESGIMEITEGLVQFHGPVTVEEMRKQLMSRSIRSYSNKIVINKIVIEKDLTIAAIKEKIRKGEYMVWKKPETGGDVAPNTATTGVGTKSGNGEGTDSKSDSSGSGKILLIAVFAAGVLTIFIGAWFFRRKMQNQLRK